MNESPAPLSRPIARSMSSRARRSPRRSQWYARSSSAQASRSGSGSTPGSFEDLDRGLGAPLADRRVGVAHDRDVDVDGGLEERVAVGVVERLDEERQGFRRAVEVDDLAKGEEHPGPVTTLGDLGQDLAQESRRRPPRRRPGDGRPTASIRSGCAVGLVGDPRGPREQVGGQARSAAGDGDPGGGLELGRHRRIPPVDRRGPLDRPLERVVDRLGQRPAECRAARPGGASAYAVEAYSGWAARSRSPSATRTPLRHASSTAGRGVAAEDPLEQPDGRLRRHGDDEEGISGRLAQRRQVVADERPGLRRHRERLARAPARPRG